MKRRPFLTSVIALPTALCALVRNGEAVVDRRVSLHRVREVWGDLVPEHALYYSQRFGLLSQTQRELNEILTIVGEVTESLLRSASSAI